MRPERTVGLVTGAGLALRLSPWSLVAGPPQSGAQHLLPPAPTDTPCPCEEQWDNSNTTGSGLVRRSYSLVPE